MQYRKIFLAFAIIFALCSCSFAAENIENNDIYVRKDLFEAYMKNIDSKFDQIFERLTQIDNKLENLTQAVSELGNRVTKLETKVDGVYIALSNRIDGLEKRVDDFREDTRGRIGDLNGSIYLWSVILGLIAGLPFFKSLYNEYEAKRQAQRQSFTLEDVEKLIEAKMKGNLSNAV